MNKNDENISFVHELRMACLIIYEGRGNLKLFQNMSQKMTKTPLFCESLFCLLNFVVLNLKVTTDSIFIMGVTTF